jgi:hypothetical protein
VIRRFHGITRFIDGPKIEEKDRKAKREKKTKETKHKY